MLGPADLCRFLSPSPSVSGPLPVPLDLRDLRLRSRPEEEEVCMEAERLERPGPCTFARIAAIPGGIGATSCSGRVEEASMVLVVVLARCAGIRFDCLRSKKEALGNRVGPVVAADGSSGLGVMIPEK